MSGASFTEENIIDSDDNNDDYDLSLSLQDTEDDFNIEDITEEQVKEILADEENRFLLEAEDEPLESTSSQINIIDRRVNDKPSGKGKSNDSKSYRNTSNLITIDCDEEEDEDEEEEEEDEEGNELDDRRHSKFKSERVIRNNDKKAEEKDIPETLEAVVVDTKDSSKNNRSQSNRGQSKFYNNQRGKGGNFVPSSRPFIGNNSLSSMGLLPTPLQSFNRIHVNPNFKPLARQGPRMGNPMEYNSFRTMRPRGEMQHPRMSAHHRPSGPRPVASFTDVSQPGTFSAGPIIVDPIEALFTSQTFSEQEIEDYAPSHRMRNNNNLRPPLFSEPFSDSWSNQMGVPNHQPWMKHPNRPGIGNFQRVPGFFNHEPSLRLPLLGSFQRGAPVNNPLFGSLPRQPYRFPNLPIFNQPTFPLMNPSMELSRNQSSRIDITPHPVPPPQRLPMNHVHDAKSSSGPSNRPQPGPNSRASTQLHDNKRQNSSNSSASSSSVTRSGKLSKESHPFKTFEPKAHSSSKQDFEMLDSSSPPRSINKVTSSPGQRPPRPSTSNINLKNIRTIKTINSNVSSSAAEARKAALLKTKAARRFLQKENMNRGVSSVKQVEVVDLVPSTSEIKEDTNDQSNQQHQPEQQQQKQQPMVIDLDIDEEYKKKLEEQKRLREEIIRMKEERRKQMVAEKMKHGSAGAATSIPAATCSTSSSTSPDQKLRRINPLTSTLIERASPPREVHIINEKRSTQPISLKRKGLSSSEESTNLNNVKIPQSSTSSTSTTAGTSTSSSPSSSEVRTVEIKGLAFTTTKATITKLCTSIGPIEDYVVDVTDGAKKAIVTFKNSQDARQFHSRYQRHLVDLCVIQVSLLW